jgi:glycosyltransferase involved in cell wall biosynthesis
MLLGVLRNLDPIYFESEVCCIQDRGELAKEVDAMGIPLHVLGLMQRKRFDLQAVSKLRKLIRERGIDLVHCHLYHANLYGRLAAWCEKVPAIASVHNTYSQKKWHRHLINRLLAKFSYCVTVGSLDVERDVLKHDHVEPDKLLCLPNCIDLDRTASLLTAEDAKAQLEFDPANRVIATVGRMEAQKGHLILLDAFARLRESHSDNASSLRLLIIGDGRLRAKTELEAERLGIANFCRFPGSIENLGDIYRAVDLFVMPSLWEGLSLAMLEAMAAGLPIVATDVGGARDVLGDNQRGVLVPPGDAEALTLALAQLLIDSKRRSELAAAGCLHVRERYSIVGLSRQLERLYEAAVAARKEVLYG